MRSFEQSLSLLDVTGPSLSERLVLVDAVTSYVGGFVASEVAILPPSGLSQEQWDSDQAEYAHSLKSSGNSPLSAIKSSWALRSQGADRASRFQMGAHSRRASKLATDG
jgi:hypothetical protein